jgi:glycosyltransferase involved in cell wall biosynthesis
VEWKGQHILLQAIASLLPRYPQLQILIIGGPGAGGTAYADELRRLAGTLGIEASVRFLGHRDDVPRLLPAMDVLVHASTSPEPFGRVVIEAMAAGVAVVGTAAGAIPEIVRDEVEGLLVPPGDAPAMASALAIALDHPELRASWVEAARETVAERFNLAQYVRGVEKVYEGILS